MPHAPGTPEPRRRVARWAHPVLAALLLAGTARGQFPQPFLEAIAPAGGRAGEAVEVTLSGTNLETVQMLRIDHPGIRALRRKPGTFVVVVAVGVPPGHYDIRAEGRIGVSNPRTFVVGDLPESGESEPNDTPAQANPLALGSVVQGSIGAADVDSFRIEGARGRRLLLRVDAARIDSRLDATLGVVRPDGTFVAEDRDSLGADPLLDLTLPDDGPYIVQVHDAVYGGSKGHVYRLTAGDGPWIDAVTPLSIEPGHAAEVSVVGRNLGVAAGPEGVERSTAPVAMPDLLRLIRERVTPRTHVDSARAGRLGVEFAIRTLAGTSPPTYLAAALAPVVAEREPNGEAANVQTVTVPCEISGTFEGAGDVDGYRFPAKKGEVWHIEVDSERLGVRSDPMFVLQKVDAQGNVTELAAAEDTAVAENADRFPRSTLDPTLRWVAPEDGLYQLQVRELYPSGRPGLRPGYRLSIRPERPGVLLVLASESATQPSAVALRRGGRATLRALAFREEGFAGPIRVEALGLPTGVRAEPVVIAAGQSHAPLVLEADPDAVAGPFPIRAVGRTRWGDRKESLDYRAGEGLPAAIETEAIFGGIVWPPAGDPATGGRAPARAFQSFPGAVVPDEAPLALRANATRVELTQGSPLRLSFEVVRKAGLAGDVVITLPEPPPKVSLAPITVGKDQLTAQATVVVPRDLAPGSYTLVFQATAPFALPSETDPKATTSINLLEPSNPILLRVRAAPVTLAVDAKGGTVPRNGVLDIGITVARQNGFLGPLRISLRSDPGPDLSAEAVRLEQGTTSAILSIRAGSSAAEGARQVGVIATAEVGGEAVEVEELVGLTIPK